ncbi:Mariner Mos1 transposase, partial [Acromyrmex echinatior]
VIFLYDNARPHVAKVVKKYLETLKWDVLPHPPYSPNIAPSDYWLFRRMQHDLASHFSNIGSPPKTSHFFEMEFENCLRDGKK